MVLRANHFVVLFAGLLATSPAWAAKPNPLLGHWVSTSAATCGIATADFLPSQMALHFAATRFDAAYDRTTPNIYYEVKPGEVIIHDNNPGGGMNAPAYEFDSPDTVHLGGTDRGCSFRRGR